MATDKIETHSGYTRDDFYEEVRHELRKRRPSWDVHHLTGTVYYSGIFTSWEGDRNTPRGGS